MARYQRPDNSRYDCTVCFLAIIKGQEKEDSEGNLFHAACLAKHQANLAECAEKGHDLDLADSYAGPESAKEYFTCTRCGFSPPPVIYY